jgi:hypothetical protein
MLANGTSELIDQSNNVVGKGVHAGPTIDEQIKSLGQCYHRPTRHRQQRPPTCQCFDKLRNVYFP